MASLTKGRQLQIQLFHMVSYCFKICWNIYKIKYINSKPIFAGLCLEYMQIPCWDVLDKPFKVYKQFLEHVQEPKMSDIHTWNVGANKWTTYKQENI